jgi:CelD/BcsL family acetyltransferase involved in cellulose biosynthesis
MITAEVLPATQGIDNLRTAWERLFGEAGREPSLSWAWSRAIMRNHLANNRDWFTLVLRRDCQPAAIVPMVATRMRSLGLDVVTLQPIQERNLTHSDLLMAAEDPQLLDAWLDELSRLPVRWDVLVLTRMLEGSPLLTSLQQALARRGQPHRLRVEQPSYFTPLPASFDTYLAARSGKFRNYLRRAEKRLAAEGTVGFEVVDAVADIDSRYEEMLEVERGSWKHAHGTAISAIAHQSGFYRDLCAGAREAGMLHLSFLRLEGVAVAYNLGVLVAGRYYYLKTSFVERWREHGVATIGRARLVRHLIESGCREFDFPAEPYEWEKQWADELRWHRSLFVFRKGLRGRLLQLASACRDRLRRRHDRRLVHSNARDLRAPGCE